MARSEPRAGGLGHRLRLARIDAAAAEALDQIAAIEKVGQAARRNGHSRTASALRDQYAARLREEGGRGA